MTPQTTNISRGFSDFSLESLRLSMPCICLQCFRNDSPSDFDIEDSCEAGAEAGKRLPWPSGPRTVTFSLGLNWKWRSTEGSDRHPCDPAFLCVTGLCAQLAITDVALKLTPSLWPVVSLYFMQHVMFNMTAMSSVLLTSSSVFCFFINFSPRNFS